MTSATYRSTGAAGRHAEGRGYGLVIFGAVLLAVIGFFNLLDGIAAIANSHIFVGNASADGTRPGRAISASGADSEQIQVNRPLEGRRA